MQPGPVRQPNHTQHNTLAPSAASNPAYRRLKRVWDEYEQRVVHEYEEVGEEFSRSFRLGTMKAVIVFKPEETQLIARKIWLSHQDRALANLLVQTLSVGYLWPDRPIRIEVDWTQPALLEALDGLPIYSHAMEKFIDNTNEPYLTGICIPILMGNQEVASFHRAMHNRVGHWYRDMIIPPGHQDQYAEPEVARHVLETLAWTAGTAGHWYLGIFNGGYEEVGRLWLRLTEYSRLFHLKYIEVNPDKRGMGFGKGAVALCESISFLMGLNMRVDIFGEDQASEQLFRSIGFVTVAKSFVMTG